MTSFDCSTEDIYWKSELMASPAPGYRLRVSEGSSDCLRYVNGIAQILTCSGGVDEIWSDTVVDYANARFNLRPYSNQGLCLTQGVGTGVGLAPCSGQSSQVWTDPIKCKRNFPWIIKSCNYVPLPNVVAPTNDRERAANYANEWYNKTNAAYSHENQYGTLRAMAGSDENDCTNFVSQALRAGGFSYAGLWLYQNKSSLSAWQRAGGEGSLPREFLALGRYQSPITWSGHTVPGGIRVGDVIGVDYGNHDLPASDPNYSVPDGKLDHNMMVIENGGTDKTTFVAYHTRDARRTFNEFYNRVNNPATVFYWYRVNYPDGQ